MTVTIGSLCTGYRGLDMAAEQVTGGATVWHCEYDGVKKDGSLKGPRRLLEHRFPDVPNHVDVKALTWADHPVDVLTGGYPCQPFSGAGKRLGTEDERHIFPWIALGVERMRPTLLLLENVRDHLSLGFDIVLAELDRLEYDVRWCILRASDIGACHGRPRLWIAARAREAGGWPMPTGYPVAMLRESEWIKPSDGLFGPMVMPKNPKGSVPMWPSGCLVGGIAWETSAPPAAPGGPMLPTPRATRGGSNTETRDLLMPTPRSTDTNGAGQHGDGGLDLRTAVSLLPTPKARDHKGCDPNPRGVDLNQAVHDLPLLPTPKTGPNRASRGALTGTSPGCDNGGAGQWSAPQLEQGGGQELDGAGEHEVAAAAALVRAALRAVRGARGREQLAVEAAHLFPALVLARQLAARQFEGLGCVVRRRLSRLAIRLRWELERAKHRAERRIDVELFDGPRQALANLERSWRQL